MNAPAPVKKANQRSQSVNTPEVRIAFPFLHEKRVKNAAGQPLKTPRYDAVLLFPKITNDPATCTNYKLLSDLCMEAAGKMWPGAGWPAGGNWPLKDGDIPYVAKPKPGVVPKTAEQVAAANAWRVGHWVVEATNYLDLGPKIAVLRNGMTEEIPAKTVNGVTLYKSGDYGIAHISFYAYENEQWGTNCSLEGFLFTRPGEVIGNGGARSAAQMFGGIAAPPSAPQPGPPRPPGAPVAAPPTAPTAAPPLAPALPSAPPGPPMPPGVVGAALPPPLPAFPR